MVGFLERMLGRSSGKGSGSKAKERLEFILVHDRINLPPERLEELKAEILAVISKYVYIDESNVDIALQRRDRNPLLIAEIPFHKAAEGIEKDDPDYKPPAPPDEDSAEEDDKATE
jgi:cell division topological specificity factor